MARSQSSVEFAVLTAVVLILFAVFLGLTLYRLDLARMEGNVKAVYDLAKSFSNEVDLAKSSTDCYVREFRLPVSLQGLDYLVTVPAGSKEVVFVYEEVQKVILLPEAVHVSCIHHQDGRSNRIAKNGDKVYLNWDGSGQHPCSGTPTLEIC
jgi:hypothetical protein